VALKNEPMWRFHTCRGCQTGQIMTSWTLLISLVSITRPFGGNNGMFTGTKGLNSQAVIATGPQFNVQVAQEHIEYMQLSFPPHAYNV